MSASALYTVYTRLSLFLILHCMTVQESDEDASSLAPDANSRMYYARRIPFLHSLEELEARVYVLFRRLKSNSSMIDTNRTEILDSLNEYIKDYEDTTLRLKRNYKSIWNKNGNYKVGWNPLATAHMIRRMSSKAPELLARLDRISELSQDVMLINAYMRDNGLQWPILDDFEDVLESVIKIQHTHHLHTEDIIDGKIFGAETHVKLSGSDCISIGSIASQKGYHASAVYWLRNALRKLKSEGAVDQVPVVSKLFQKVIRRHNKNWDMSNPNVFTSKIQGNLDHLIHRHDVLFHKYKDQRKQGWDDTMPYVYQSLCMGGTTQTLGEQAQLFCWYERKQSHYLLINPAKVELLSKSPLILRYHDFLGENIIKFLIDKASKDLEFTEPESIEGQSGNQIYETTDGNTYAGSTIIEEDYSATYKLQRNLESVIGYSLGPRTFMDELSVLSYVFGAQFQPHTDAPEDLSLIRKVEKSRIPTFLLNLSNVEKGGGTAFLYPGIVAEPVRGSVIYWENIDTSGTLDQRTWHGGCPVILGEKWVANKYKFAPGTRSCIDPKYASSRPFDFYINGRLLKIAYGSLLH